MATEWDNAKLGNKSVEIFLWKSPANSQNKEKNNEKQSEKKREEPRSRWDAEKKERETVSPSLWLLSDGRKMYKLKHRFENLLPAIDKPHRTKMASCSIFSTCFPTFSPHVLLFLLWNIFALGSFRQSVGYSWMRERWLYDLQKDANAKCSRWTERAFIFL